MNNSSKTFSNLENAVSRASAMENLANVMSVMQTSSNILPDAVKQMQVAQKAMSSPAYQALIRQQEILNQMSIPSVLMKEFQAASNLVQPALQNMNLSGFNNLVQSENFLESALEVQKASINFLTEMKKLDNYQQKTLVEILKELRLKKNAEVELPEDFPTKLKKSFKNLFESVKNFWNKHEDDIITILPNIQTIVDYINTGEISNLGAVLAISLSLRKILRGENFGEQK